MITNSEVDVVYDYIVGRVGIPTLTKKYDRLAVKMVIYDAGFNKERRGNTGNEGDDLGAYTSLKNGLSDVEIKGHIRDYMEWSGRNQVSFWDFLRQKGVGRNGEYVAPPQTQAQQAVATKHTGDPFGNDYAPPRRRRKRCGVVGLMTSSGPRTLVLHL